MMNLTALSCAALACLCLGSPSPEGVPTALAWQLEAGKQYRVQSNSTVETTTTTQGSEQVESNVQAFDQTVRVDEVSAGGDMLLTVTTESYHMTKKSAGFSVKLSALRDQNGEVKVQVKVNSPTPELLNKDVSNLFETLAHNTTNLVYHITLDGQGQVHRNRLIGDPYHNLPSNTDVTRMMTQALQVLGGTDELPGALAARIFVQLPVMPVKTGETWPVSRTLVASGVQLEGRGPCSLVRVSGDKNSGMASLVEDLNFNVRIERFKKNMTDVMDRTFKDMGLDLKLSVDLIAPDVQAKIRSEFDVQAGLLRTMKWSQVTATIGGSMTMGEQGMQVDVRSSSSGACTWSEIERK
jgi:hypothetical protein